MIVNNPVFADIGIMVQVQFCDVIMTGIGRGGNFNNPVRRADAAARCKLVRVTYDRDIRLKYRILFVIELYAERGSVDTAFTAL